MPRLSRASGPGSGRPSRRGSFPGGVASGLLAALDRAVPGRRGRMAPDGPGGGRLTPARSSPFVLAASALSALIVRRRVDRLNLIEVLKTRE